MMHDSLTAKAVELTIDDTGKLWVNIDGICVARVGLIQEVHIEIVGQPKQHILIIPPKDSFIARLPGPPPEGLLKS